MTYYLIRATQTAETWQQLMDNPKNRAETSRCESSVHAGQSLGYWYSLDGIDIYSIIEAPSEAKLAPLVLRQKASGAFSSISVSVVLTPERLLVGLATAHLAMQEPRPSSGDSASVVLRFLDDSRNRAIRS